MFNRCDSQIGCNSSAVFEQRQSYRGSMNGPSRARRPRGRRRHALEWLEPRCLLAANLGNIVAVQPYDVNSLNAAPQQLVITLDQPYVPFLMGNFDVQLEKINRDGTMTPIWTVNTSPPEATDDTGTELIIPAKRFDPSDGLF